MGLCSSKTADVAAPVETAAEVKEEDTKTDEIIGSEPSTLTLLSHGVNGDSRSKHSTGLKVEHTEPDKADHVLSAASLNLVVDESAVKGAAINGDAYLEPTPATPDPVGSVGSMPTAALRGNENHASEVAR